MDKEDERRSSIETNGLTQKPMLNFLLEGGDEFSLYSAHIYCTRKQPNQTLNQGENHEKLL